MVTNIHIVKGKNDSSASLLSKFTKKIKETGIIPKVKSKRYQEREFSKLKLKKDKLVNLIAKDRYEHLKKMGKLVTKTYNRPSAAPSISNNTTTAK